MKKLTKEGVGTETMQAQPLTPEQEEKLWCLRIFRCVLVGTSPCNAIDFESNIEDSMSVAAKTANCTIWISPT